MSRRQPPDSTWHKVAELDDLPDGRVKTVHRRPPQPRAHPCRRPLRRARQPLPAPGRPARRGLDREGLLRCPWHGYDYDPLTGTPPPGFTDAPACFPVEVRDDGVYVELAAEPPHERTVSDVMVETMVAWGVTHVFGMVGHSNLGFADAMRRQEEAGQPHVRRHPPRGRGRVRGVGLRQAHRPAGGVLRHRRARARPTCSPGSTTPRSTGRRCWRISGQVPSKVLGRGAFQDVDLTARVRRRRQLLEDGAARVGPRRAHDARAQARARRAGRRAPRAARRGAGAGRRATRRRVGAGRAASADARDRAARRRASTTRSRSSAARGDR